MAGMVKNIERLAEKLGARVVGRVPEYLAGTFGVASLARVVLKRLERYLRAVRRVQ